MQDNSIRSLQVDHLLFVIAALLVSGGLAAAVLRRELFARLGGLLAAFGGVTLLVVVFAHVSGQPVGTPLLVVSVLAAWSAGMTILCDTPYDARAAVRSAPQPPTILDLPGTPVDDLTDATPSAGGKS